MFKIKFGVTQETFGSAFSVYIWFSLFREYLVQPLLCIFGSAFSENIWFSLFREYLVQPFHSIIGSVFS